MMMIMSPNTRVCCHFFPLTLAQDPYSVTVWAAGSVSGVWCCCYGEGSGVGCDVGRVEVDCDGNHKDVRSR